jgi:hypothetical protein
MVHKNCFFHGKPKIKKKKNEGKDTDFEKNHPEMAKYVTRYIKNYTRKRHNRVLKKNHLEMTAYVFMTYKLTKFYFYLETLTSTAPNKKNKKKTPEGSDIRPFQHIVILYHNQLDKLIRQRTSFLLKLTVEEK